MTLVERCAGVGALIVKDQVHRRVRYNISRFQAMLEGSGLPIPGGLKIEGTIELDAQVDLADLIGAELILTLEDGRSLGVTLVDASGHIHSRAAGPHGCSCC